MYFFIYGSFVSCVFHAFDHSCLVFFMLLRLFIAALWSPAGKGLTSWLLFVMFNCYFVTFPCSILGQEWYLIVSIPDLCRLSYYDCFSVMKICLICYALKLQINRKNGMNIL